MGCDCYFGPFLTNYHSAGKDDRGPLFALFLFRLIRSRSVGLITLQNILNKW